MTDAQSERDGITGAAVTYVRLGACALPAEGGYRLAVDYVVEADGSATLEKLEYIDGKQHVRRDGFEASIRGWVGRMRHEP